MNLAVHLLSFLCLIVALHLFARMRWQKDQLAKILRSIHSPQKNHTLLCSPCKVFITLLKALDIPFTHSNPLWKFWHPYPPTLHRLALQELFEALNTLECHSAHLQTPSPQRQNFHLHLYSHHTPHTLPQAQQTRSTEKLSSLLKIPITVHLRDKSYESEL